MAHQSAYPNVMSLHSSGFVVMMVLVGGGLVSFWGPVIGAAFFILARDLLGAYTEAGLVMVLFAIGEALEGYTMQRARDSIRRLMEVAPQEAIVLRPCLDCKAHLGQDGYTGGP